MPHRFLVKDIAFQAGLSTATVDRVLHGRDHVRAQTRLRIETAIKELERQEETAARGGRSLVIDVVMEAPDRFSRDVRAAFEAQAGALYPAIFRPRFQFAERIEPARFAALLDRIRLRGTDGVVVKGPDVAQVRDAVNRLTDAGIPVFALVTDVTESRRLAYVGMDNQAAGQTAAFLIATALGDAGGKVLVTLSSNQFRGEEDRVEGFRAALAEHYPHLTMIAISEGFGSDEATGPLSEAALRREPEICAVYSVGGGNRSVLDAFDRCGRVVKTYVAHDLDGDNRKLLAERRIHFVLHHDLSVDVRNIYWRLITRKGEGLLHSALTVHTPFNIPGNPRS